MDVTQLNSFNQVASEASFKSKQKKEVSEKKGNLFKRELKKADKVLSSTTPSLTGDEELAGLMDTLFDKGEDLAKDPTLERLKAYRNAVSLFFKYVVKNSLKFDSVEGRLNPKTFERKCYALISVVDKKIDDIAINVLGDQKKQFDILGAVEEINGLIVDLVS